MYILGIYSYVKEKNFGEKGKEKYVFFGIYVDNICFDVCYILLKYC